jgi:hypothetical protein
MRSLVSLTGSDGDEFPTAEFLRRFRGLAIDEDKAAFDEFLHARAREFRAVGGHEPVKPRPSVRINRQKFMHHELGSNRHGQIVAGAIRGRGWPAQRRQIQKVGTAKRGLPALAYVLVPTHTFASRATPGLLSRTPHVTLERLRLSEERGG